jgi:hypothetical protein
VWEPIKVHLNYQDVARHQRDRQERLGCEHELVSDVRVVQFELPDLQQPVRVPSPQPNRALVDPHEERRVWRLTKLLDARQPPRCDEAEALWAVDDEFPGPR